MRGSFQPKKAPTAAAAAASSSQLKARAKAKAPAAAAAKPPQMVVRRAVLEDVAALQAIYDNSSLQQRENVIRGFGHHALQTLLETAALCLVVEAQGNHGGIVAFAAFGDESPHYISRIIVSAAAHEKPIATVESSGASNGTAEQQQPEGEWAEWVRKNFETEADGMPQVPGGLTTFNTSWLRYLLVRESSVAKGAIEKLLRALFSTLTQIDQLLVSIPMAVDPFAPMDSAEFQELHVRVSVLNTASQAVLQDLNTVRLFACPRAAFLPDLLLRRARIEDNDDLVPICNAQSEILTAIYGEFYLATLIQNQNDHQHALVAEVDGRAVGLTGITDQVDVKLLQECFDLDAYEQLRKQKSAAQELEEAGGPTPLSRMNNIFLTIVSSPAPLSAAERAAAAQAAAAAASSKRASMGVPSGGGKRASFSAGGLAAIASQLKSEAAPVPSATGSPATVPAGAISPNMPSQSLLTPSASTTSLAVPGAEGSGSGTTTPKAAAFQPITVDKFTTFPAHWLGYYLDAYRPDPYAVAAAQERKEKRERIANDSEEDEEAKAKAREGPDEAEEAILLNPQTIAVQFAAALVNRDSALTNEAFNDAVVQVMAELEDVSMGALLVYLEAAVKVPASLPTRPPPVILDASVDDGTAKDNVFCVTLFCLDDAFESRSIDVLKAAFDLYPERMYCVLTLPHTSPPAAINLLNYFTFVPPTPRNTFGHALYLMHRETVATLNALNLHAPLLRVPSLAAPRTLFQSLLSSNTAHLLASVAPLIDHLENVKEIKRELEQAVEQAMNVAKLKQEGSEHARLKAQTIAGLSGQALLDKKKALTLQLLESKTSPTETLLISCQGTVVGLVVFNRLSQEEVGMLRGDFSVEDFVSLEDLPPVDVPKAMLPQVNPFDPTAALPAPLEDVTASVHLNILTFVLNPLWSRQVGFICQEMLRLKKAHVLYYQVWSKRAEGEKALEKLAEKSGLRRSYAFHNGVVVPQLLETFVQVRPRRRPAVANQSVHVPLPCALHILSRRLISQPKSVINSRLVLVGSSTTALSFLETLLLIPDKQYSSITLLSKDGLTGGASGAGDDLAGGAHFLPWSLSYSEAWLDRLNFASRIKVVKNTMVDLDSVNKTLKLADGSSLPYDVLVLTPGLQNQLPLRLIRLITRSSLIHEFHLKEEARIKWAEEERDARRKKKAQEQGLEGTDQLDAEAIARLDEELEREAQARAMKERSGENDEDESNYSGEDGDDTDSVASFDSKGGRRVRRRRGRFGVHSHHGGHGHGEDDDRFFHADWKKWTRWSDSGLEMWEGEFGQMLEKQRALALGTLDARAALESNAAARARATTSAGAAEGFDPSELDLTPWGITGIYELSSEEHVRQLKQAFEKNPRKCRAGGWVVNGASLDALTSVQGLIELGVSPQNITWVHPLTNAGTSGTSGQTPSSTLFLSRSGAAPGSANSLASDPLILQRVLSSLHALGVQVQAGKVIKAVRQEEGKVQGVTLVDAPEPGKEKPTKDQPEEKTAIGAVVEEDPSAIELPVVGVIGCGELDVDPYVFRSVHGNSLVYDGRLVLNHSFQTTVPTIYAGGPIAKFSRAYGTQVLQLENYNSVEVGQKLCEAVLRTALDVPGAAAAEKAAALANANAVKSNVGGPKKMVAPKLPPLGVKPHITQALLPGGLLYFHASIPTHRQIAKPNVLVTQNAQRLVRLVFNDYNILHAITIVSTSPEDPKSSAAFLPHSIAIHHNLIQLIGMPASYMNRILFRYQQKQITDLVDFLSGEWSFALYHESFAHLRAYLHYFLLENRLEIVALIDRIIQLFTTTTTQRGAESSEVERNEDGEVIAMNEVESGSSAPVDPFLVSQLTSLLPPAIKDVVQRALLRFLRQHENHLPGYAIPQPYYPGPQAKPRVQAQ